MKIIQTLTEKIHEEIHDAKSYTKMAIHYKEEYPDMARALFGIANQELEHMQILHGLVSDLIKDYRNEKGEPPASMMAVYEYLHNKEIEKVADVKALMDAYKNS